MKIPVWILAVVALAGLLVGGFVGHCSGKPTKAEQKADSVLADTTAFRLARASRDSAIAARIRETQALRRERNRWRDSANALLQDVDKEASAAATLTDVPSGTTHDTITHLTAALDAQKQVAARYRSVVVPILQRVIASDELIIDQQDVTIEKQRLALLAEYKRSDELTTALRDLRKDRKGGGKFLGFLPPWTDEALMVVGATYVGIQIGRRS